MISTTNLAILALLGTARALPRNVERVETRASDDTWDYVIIGGGVTGLIVANRLTENPKTNVLVIEAGAAYDNPNIRMPYGTNLALNETLLWPYISEPEPAIANQTFPSRVARVLGGGSIVNGMMYDRGAAADFDAWEALGNKGWGWEEMYPFFKKSTEFIPPSAEIAKQFGITWNPKAYGNGPLKIGISDFQYPDVKDYFAAFKGAGVYAARSGDTGDAYGTSWYANTMNPLTGERSHARNSYYDPVSKRSNLKVLLETLATEIVFESGKELTAKGVKITDRKTGALSAVYAKKELILAAGAVNTPQLLQLSGIGPKSVLQAAGIPVKLEHDGVGANFQDHPYTRMHFNISNMSTPNPSSFKDLAFNASAWEQYRVNKTGPLTQARGNSLAFVPLPQVDPERYSSLADQVRSSKNDAYLPPIYKNSKKLLKGFKTQRKVLADLYENTKAGVVEYKVPGSGDSQLVGLEKPISRGTITINPADPQGPPKIFYNSLSNPIDRAVLGSCVRFIRKVWARPELSKFSLVETSPGAQYTTDDDILQKSVELGTIAPTLSHPSCSCAMMPEDQGGCVSDKLLFYGVKKMSIIDASIIPLVPSQHLQSTMYAIGEKAATIIKSRG
ncbi:hypothetical protein PTMSG1_03162 [Pyrenophora teres f. maculata]|nr:hypothetical protein PTMSG1_03162 [Pyrenophora teres f. maculata]